jgi:hypothetical protein
MSILGTLLNNPFVQTLIVGGAGWLANKIMGKRADTKAGKATAALAAAVAQMAQVALTEPGKSAKEMVSAFKGIVAIRFGAAGFDEKARAPYQPLIDAAIAKAVEQWVKHHPAPASLTMPVWARLQMSELK